MISAPIPQNENARLQDLRDCGLLDTPGETEFDEIVKLASDLCDMPISLISLVDADRQWFKAKIGLDENETHRDFSFCAHAILQEDLFEVPDTLEDSRFSDNPMVTGDPEIRFYAGMPLLTSSGNRLGTLCVIDREPRQLTEQQRFGLKVLAANVIKVAELRVKNKELSFVTENQKRIISILAHDVRNPLTAIKSIIELKQTDVIDTDELTKMLNLAGSQLTSTIDMVENIVSWGQQQAKFGRLQLEHFDLSALIDRIFATESLKSIAKHNRLVNNIPHSVYMRSDERAIEFILRNLISNANKFTQDGHIMVDMYRQGVKVVIKVKDTGVGMTEKQATELLENNNFKSTLGTGKEKGSGLGMTLVKEFIERLDGNLSVESAVGKGTCFTLVV